MKQLIFFIILLFSSLLFAQKNADDKENNKELEQLYENNAYSEIVELLKKNNDKLSMREYNLLTISYARIQQYANGLVSSNKMIEKCKEKNDTTNLVIAYNRKVENLLDLERLKEALKLCETIEPTFRVKDSIQFQNLCFKWGILYKLKKDYNKALEVYDKITHKKYRELTLFTNNYATILEGLGRSDEAIEYYKKAVEIDLKNHKDVGLTYSNIAHILMSIGRLKEAQKYLDLAENSITKKTPLRTQKIIYKYYYDYYQGTKNTFYASIYLSFIEDTNNKIYNKKLDTELEALKISYESKRRLNEEIESYKKQKLYGTIILLLIILILVSILFYLKYRNIKDAHKNVVTEQKLLRSQMTPHFIFNSLSVLQGMILNNENKKSISYLSKFSKLLRLILENSREKVVPIREELEAIKNYIDLHNMRSDITFEYALILDENLDDLDIYIPPMLIQPFIENAIEHGFQKKYEGAKITIHISLKDNKLICIIKDNGVGLNAKKSTPNTTKKSLSTQITKERLKLMAKEFKVETGLTIQDRGAFNEKGTQINLTLPYKIL